MAGTYWDPANLFQIAYYGNYGEVQCLGLDRYKKRCKWTIQDQKYCDVQTLLANMTARKPSEVTSDELTTMAGLCLCQYHCHQRHEVVGHWKAVVRRAVEHRGKAKTDGPSSATVRAEPLFGSALKAEDVLSFRLELMEAMVEGSKATNERLQNELTTAQGNFSRSNRERESLGESVAKLRLANSALETANKELQALQENAEVEAQMVAAACDQQITQMKADIDSAKARLEEALGLKEKLRAENTRLQNEREMMQRDTEKLRIDNDLLRGDREKLHSERSSLMGQLERLQIDSSSATGEKRRLATEVEATSHALQQSRTGVQDGPSAIANLDARIASMSGRMHELEQNISSCCLHGFGIRLGNIKRKVRMSSRRAVVT